MEREYDIVIIGTGVAGTTLAHQVGYSGLNIAVIDSREYGGTCPLRGCDPKKALASASEAADWNNRLIGRGAGTESPLRIDWPSLIEFKRTFTEDYPRKIEKSLFEMGIDTYHGRAYFEDENTVAVGEDKLKGVYIFIAAGARPRKLGIPGEEYLTSSEEFMETEKLPERIVFVGGGYISFEFAHIARRAGCRVTILQRSERPLEQFDPDLVDMLLKASEVAGIEVLTNNPVVAVEKEGGSLLVRTEFKTESHSETHTFFADMVVHGAGRVPDLEDLQPENAGIRVENGAIVVDKHMRTSNPRVYAGGDCTSEGMPLTPVATLQARVAAANVLDGNRVEADYTGIPRAVFTIPPLASVGISVPPDSTKYRVVFRDRSNWYSTRRTGMEFAGSKVIIDKENDRIMGAHILGPNAEEAINLFAAAMRLGLKASDLKKVVYAYPGVCSDIVYML
ncbi:NAD(P)/FAD-dependent oxidoreductase [Methanosarcina sp. KYL-1]|uniref:dihydrolipoyl dehydrogenase family protein n=1 Tax=Methanosarcina sp. KYL-1 TaxID=2602068 RepID=UPI0021012CA9|nr:NAD(P)/FAD-dependent oxidoreductase [Methanosarcina sp. KYL-1]MCQ1534256.1 NAD(P)/FAD-dependent oxidoreductase [Methanosarcina sp. KYL-1]